MIGIFRSFAILPARNMDPIWTCVEGPDIQDERPRDCRHLLHLFGRVGHDRGASYAERDIGAVVDGHVVGDMVHERPSLTDEGKHIGELFRFHG